MESEAVIESGEVKGGNFEIIHPPNTLASRVSGGGQISAEMLRAAEEIVEAHTTMFTNQSKAELDHLSDIVDGMVKNPGSHAKSMGDIFKISHNIKGQGGTFGYDLVTDIAASLCSYSENLDSCDGNALSLIRAHIDAIRAVIAGKMVGDGGEIGQAISKSLGLAVTKLSD
ncbi:MAG: Hpt domain-containing protein [Alphaproteobacteria bacterium]|nr:Hpt domain-containing protein [Alphaproteobacteria bacterium]